MVSSFPESLGINTILMPSLGALLGISEIKSKYSGKSVGYKYKNYFLL